MLWLFEKREPPLSSRLVNHGQAATFLLQSGATGMGFLREKWTEDEVLNLPEGEHNYFDRKSGRLFADKGKLYATLAKGLSALANSGGGHLILGQEDDGTIDGVPEKEGRTSIREWLEQKIPALVSYPLEAFRVHTVQKHQAGTQVPGGKELVVIDV